MLCVDACGTADSFQLECVLDKKVHACVHSRIIWACSWTHDDLYFVTGSRDKKVN